MLVNIGAQNEMAEDNKDPANLKIYICLKHFIVLSVGTVFCLMINSSNQERDKADENKNTELHCSSGR